MEVEDNNNTVVETPLDFNSFEDEDLDAYIESGGVKLPAPVDADTSDDDNADEAEVVEENTQPDTTESSAENDDPSADTDTTPDPVEITALEKRVNEFAFTDNATDEVILAEESEYLSLVEIPAPIQAMIERRDNAIAKLSEVAPMDENVQRHMTAITHMATEFVQDPETGAWYPNTSQARSFFKSLYPQEYNQMIGDELMAQSEKYPKYSRLFEFIKDEYGLPDQALVSLDSFLLNGGHFPRPSYAPEGINRDFLDAYWYSRKREEYEERREKAMAIWYDKESTALEKATAQTMIAELNADLQGEQRVLDGERIEASAKKRETIDNVTLARTEGAKAYNQTVVTFIQKEAEDLATQLEPIVGKAAKSDAFGFTQLIINALSDNDEFAQLAQQQINELGIKIKWAEAGQVMQLIWDTEAKIKYVEKMNADFAKTNGAKTADYGTGRLNLVKNEKLGHLRSLTALTKTIKGQYIAIKIAESGKAIKKQVEEAPLKQAKMQIVRPKASGVVPVQNKKEAQKTLENMTEEELDAYIIEQKRHLGISSYQDI